MIHTHMPQPHHPRIGLNNYLTACKESGLQGKYIGVPWNVLSELADEVAHVVGALRTLWL